MSVANSEMRGCSKRQISTAPGRAAVEQFWVCAPQLRSGQVISILRPHGFQWVGQSGSHQKWRYPAYCEADHCGRSSRSCSPAWHHEGAIIEGSGIALTEWLK